jgi:hypothetical protein
MSEDAIDWKSVRDTLGELSDTLAKLNDTPRTAEAVRGADDQSTGEPGPKILSRSDIVEVRSALRTKSTQDLHAMFGAQAVKKNTGIPFEYWAAQGGRSVSAAIEGNEILTKALDTTGASALIRQDLEPILYELFIRVFPAFERFAKEPANGLVHAYNRTTTFGDAQFMTELGTVTDDKSAYERATTPVSVLATRRGISLKSQFAVLQGGAGFNPEQLELQGGLRAIAKKMQATIFGGNATNSGGSSSDEDGGYDVNAFDGLRRILNTSRAKNCDLFATTPDGIRDTIDRAVEEILQSGGMGPSVIYMHPHEKISLDLEQESKVRWVQPDRTGPVGTTVSSVNTIMGALPLVVVPGDSIGNYNPATPDNTFSGSADVRDMYILDESTISLPYLGTDGPTVLDIPIGISGQLTHLYIVFGMWGLAVKVPSFSNKVRVALV